MTDPAAASDQQPALPVARVRVDVSLAHLDRLFDYRVPPADDEAAQPGCRVKVRFAGRDVDGYVIERVAETEHQGRLQPLRRVVSPEPVLLPQIHRLCRAVADRYAGVTADVVRLAVPKRHARVEAEPARAGADEPTTDPDGATAPSVDMVADRNADAEADGWSPYPGAAGFLTAVQGGGGPRAAWTTAPGEDWPTRFVAAAEAAHRRGRGALLLVPDARDLARLAEACRTAWGPALSGPGSAALTSRDQGSGQPLCYVSLSAELGPSLRYRAFLAASRGRADVVIGTRAAAFAPVHDLGLIAIWDDADDSFAEPRAPYPQVLSVAALRAHLEGCALLAAAELRSLAAEALVEDGWLQPLDPTPEAVRERMPRVHLLGEEDIDLERDPAGGAARIPHRGFEILRAGVQQGPVLVQVPRAGYLPRIRCADCHRDWTCDGTRTPGDPHPEAPVWQPTADVAPRCRVCGATVARCPNCGSTRRTNSVVGVRRTAEELGRAVPSVRVRTSAGDTILDRIDAEPQVVVCTPGAEPVAADGYAAALLLDGWLPLAPAALDAPVEALRRWVHAAGLVRSADRGGVVGWVGPAGADVARALVRWGTTSYAGRELGERRQAGLPPAVLSARLDGSRGSVATLLEDLTGTLRPAAQIVGPAPRRAQRGEEKARPPGTWAADPGAVAAVVSVPRGRGRDLSAALQRGQAALSADKQPPVRVQLDPDDVAL